MGQQLGLGGAEVGKLRLQHLGNALMVLLAGAAQQGLIGRILDQGVLEAIHGLRWQPLLVEEFRLHQLLQPALQGRLVPRRDGLEEGIGKVASERRSELCQAFHRCQTVQPCHQRVVQGGGNRQRRQRPRQRIALRLLLEQAGLQDHLGQFLDKQRHPIGLGHHLLDHLRRECLVARHPARHLHGLAPW